MSVIDNQDSGGGLSSFNFGDAGGAVGDLFKGFGDLAEAGEYEEASQLATENVGFAEQQTKIQDVAAQRQLFQAQGATSADVAGAGFTQGGSAGDIMRANAQQGAIQQGVINLQGGINVANYEEQASAYSDMASAAKTAASGSFFGSALSAVGSIAGFL